MDAANIDSLLQRASVIKNETMDKANTAQRVGSLLYDIIDICDELAKEMFSLGNGTGGTGGGGGGSVGSVGLQMPEGFTVSGSPVTGNGTLKVALASGFYLLTELQRRGLHTHGNQSFLDLLSVAYDGFTKYIKWTDEGKLKVAEAAKLSVAHEIFGNLFDGTQDVKGELKNVTNITASGTVKGNAADFVNVITKNLRVLGKAEFFNLVLQKISSVGGSWIISPADPFQIGWFEPSADGSRYVLYWRANDADGVLSQNTWMVRDQAICQNFNKATSKGVSNNTYWWSVVLAVSSSPVTKSVYGGKNIDDEGNKYHYIEVANDAEGSELCDGDLVPVLGDTVSHLGHRFTQTEIDSGDADYSRQAAVAFGACNTIDNGYTPGPGEEGKAIGRLVPPFFATYRGIADFNLGKYRRTYVDANESRFVGDVEIVSDRGIVPFATFVEDSIGKAQFNTFYKYSSHADGSGMCDDTSLEYRGVCVTTSASAPSEFSKYAWTKNPKDGDNGVSAIQFTCSPQEVVFNTDASGKITVTQGVTIAVTRDGGAVTKSYGSLSSVNCQATRSGDTVTIDATWKTANAGYYEQVTAVDGATYYIAPTSGSVTVPVTVEGRTYRIVIPWRTNLMATFKYFKSDVDKFLSSYQAYVATNDRNIEVMRSDIQQSADKIILAVEKMREVTVGNNYFKDCNWDFSTRWTPTLASNSTHNVVASGVGMVSSLYVYNILNDGATSAKTIYPEYGTNFAYIYGYRKPNTDSVLYTHISPRLPDGTTGRLFVPKGKYTFSARCLTNRREWLASGGIQIELFRGKNDANRYNFVPINSRPSANGVWEDSSVTFDVPEDSYVDILFGLFLQSTAGTTTSTANRTYLLIDCLQLESGPEFTGWSSRHTLAEKLYRSGIDIEAERIKLTSDNIECVNNEGEDTLRIDKHGNPTFAGAIQQTIQNIDVADGKNTYLLIDTVSNEVPRGLNSIPFSSASCYCLDVWKCANVVHIRNCDRNILLPFYIYGRWYRTQVADDEGNKRWIDKEDLLKLVGKKLIIYGHYGGGQNYLYYGIATPELDTDGIVYRTPPTGMVGMQINVEQTLILEFVHAFYKGSSGSTIYEGFFWKGRIGSTEDIDNEAGWYFE